MPRAVTMEAEGDGGGCEGSRGEAHVDVPARVSPAGGLPGAARALHSVVDVGIALSLVPAKKTQ